MTATASRAKIGLVQMSMGRDAAANMRGAAEQVRAAAAAGAQVVCLPELYRSQYFCQKEDTRTFDLAEPFPGPSTVLFQELAAELRVVVVVPFFEKRAAGVYHNSAAVIDVDGAVPGLYRKMHIPDDPAYYEKYYFAPGDLGFRVFDTAYGRIGVLICWDQWYPEGARLMALRGASILFFPTAIGWHPHEKDVFGASQHDAWRTIQRAHAIANGVYVAAVNRIGLEKSAEDAAGIEFWGGTFLCDPFGVVVAQVGPASEDVLIAEVNRARIEDVRRNWPFLRDRRIDAYGRITERFTDEA